ncbi:alkaline phosphatase [Rhodobacteraceae bacterium WD3A24]|nr:alkaline phosphatase [Rhodobacteraceae bacterium WD3A24]
MSIRLFCMTSALALTAGQAAMAEMSFTRIASFPTYLNLAHDARDQATSAEIIDATADGTVLVYTDSPLGALGMIDFTDPADPRPLDTIMLGGEPTSVAVAQGRAYVGVNTSESFVEPSGYLAVFDIASREELGRCDLSGQPDSVATAPDGSFVAIAIENERDEDLDDGAVPQLPAGTVDMFDIAEGTADCESVRSADLTGLAETAPSDPEPEYLDINAEGEVVVTLQENNHMVVLDRDGEVLSDFTAGAVDLEGIDVTEEGAITFDDAQPGRLREPDTVQWVGNDHFATANEGDYQGGSRGWTIFNQDGTVVYESGTDFERALIEAGHYPEERSGNKGVEPESLEFAIFDGTPMVFVGSERGSIIGAYDITDPAAPVLTQLLPSGVGPEGFVALPSRGLLVSANEEDLREDGGPAAHVMIFEHNEAAPAYPQLTAAGAGELIGWGAISGMTAAGNGMIYAVNDSFYAMQPRIFEIDPSERPARITRAIEVTRDGAPAQMLDLEGVVTDGEGGFWLASEGDADDLYPHAIHHVTAGGEIDQQIAFPAELRAVARRHAAEGITMVGDTLWIALQREWDDDPAGHVKLVAYNTESREWGAVHYPLNDVARGWVGLSEISLHGDHVYVIERDNQFGADAQVKAVYRVPLDQMEPAPLGGELPVVEPELVRDLIPDLEAFNGYVVDKVEGLAIMPDGTAWVSTDNDGVDDSSGETFFWSIGQM